MADVRVLVVDDSAMVRALIEALVEMTEGLTICGQAENGRQAVTQALALQPDIITMDLQMPVMGGMEAIEEIMATRPTPILVLSDVADARNAMAAVSRGALEATHKPSVDDGPEFTSRLKMLAGVPVIRHIRSRHAPIAAPALTPLPLAGKLSLAPPAPLAGEVRGANVRFHGRVFAIAVSTGGPQALAQILPRLPAHFPAPVLIAQHISDGFAAGMAAWLNELCPLTVTMAQDGEFLVPGRIYLANSTSHLAITPTRRIQLRPRADRDIYRPSCDVLLTTVAEVFGSSAVGVILTGMGRDGVKGMTAIRSAGGMTLGQDEATSVVYGMNREAIIAGSVQSVLPLAAMAGEMERLASTAPQMRWEQR
ncbi:MAG TPA: chemotaxis response regulator protein-glutamate methylesterase [Gammaproteobacteria bacterium]|nr:chemotaxis response regulator protein-glutamate methylesterase [Gammaproteobacteria bacterium]